MAGWLTAELRIAAERQDPGHPREPRLHALLANACGLELFCPGRVLQGGNAMTLADVAFWIAIMATIEDGEAAVTLEQTSTFLGAARTDLICACPQQRDLVRDLGTLLFEVDGTLQPPGVGNRRRSWPRWWSRSTGGSWSRR